MQKKDTTIDSNTRRTIMKIGWVTPIVTAVTLPVHAQTSNNDGDGGGDGGGGGGDGGGDGGGGGGGGGDGGENTTSYRGPVSGLAFIEGTEDNDNASADLCIQVTGSLFDAKLMYDFGIALGQALYAASGSIGAAPAVFAQVAGPTCLANIDIAVTSVSASSANFVISGDLNGASHINLGTGCPSSNEPLHACLS